MKSIAQACGIYCITNTANNRVYVGASKVMGTRLSTHLAALRKKRHDIPSLQADYDQFGASVFTTSVLEVVAAPAQLELREQHWLDTYRNRGAALYNQSLSSGYRTPKKRVPRQQTCPIVASNDIGKVIKAFDAPIIVNASVARDNAISLEARGLLLTLEYMSNRGIVDITETALTEYLPIPIISSTHLNELLIELIIGGYITK